MSVFAVPGFVFTYAPLCLPRLWVYLWQGGVSKHTVCLQSCCMFVWSVCLWWFRMYLHRMGIGVNLISPEWLRTPLSRCVTLHTHARMSVCLSVWEGSHRLYCIFCACVFLFGRPKSCLCSFSSLPNPIFPLSPSHPFPLSSGSGTQGGPPPGPGGIKQGPSAPTSCPTT